MLAPKTISLAREASAKKLLLVTCLAFASMNVQQTKAQDETAEPEQSHNSATLWTYVDQDKWSSQYPLCTNSGPRQSPIDIQTRQAKYDPARQLEYLNYEQPVDFKLKNNHHTAVIEPINSGPTPTIIPSWLGGREYELREIHFHWGDGVTNGSEHKVDGRAFSAEAHFVHILKGVTKEGAKDYPDSIVVIGVFLELGDDFQVNSEMASVLADVRNIDATEDEYLRSSPTSSINLLPATKQSFFTYEGSLTTPPCLELVNWVVMRDPVKVSYDNVSMVWCIYTRRLETMSLRLCNSLTQLNVR